MKIVFHDPLGRDDAEYRPLDELLYEADIVTLHVPLTNDTHHLLDSSRIQKIKQGALVLNMSRGKVVEEAALVKSLQSGQIAGAALDVFEREPLVHPELLKMEQVILSPHMAGGTHESKFQARRLCAENVALALEGLTPKTPVNSPRF